MAAAFGQLPGGGGRAQDPGGNGACRAWRVARRIRSRSSADMRGLGPRALRAAVGGQITGGLLGGPRTCRGPGLPVRVTIHSSEVSNLGFEVLRW